MNSFELAQFCRENDIAHSQAHMGAVVSTRIYKDDLIYLCASTETDSTYSVYNADKYSAVGLTKGEFLKAIS